MLEQTFIIPQQLWCLLIEVMTFATVFGVRKSLMSSEFRTRFILPLIISSIVFPRVPEGMPQSKILKTRKMSNLDGSVLKISTNSFSAFSFCSAYLEIGLQIVSSEITAAVFP